MITAAVVGVILNLSIWFALHTPFHPSFPIHKFGISFDAPVLSSIDIPALLLSLAAATAIFHFKVGLSSLPPAPQAYFCDWRASFELEP
ncbi:putative chromate transport protein [Nitrobacter sp. Nb-311A]|nr:putative chromate transport protein [Nitrobacter sp. Nb-311A]